MKISRLLEIVEEWGLVILLSAMSVIMLIQVGMRYIIGAPFSWGEELARYCQIWLVYIGAALCTRRKTHIRIEILSNIWPKSTPYTELLSDVVSAAFLIGVVFITFSYVRHFLVLNQTSPALELPMAIVSLILPIGSALMALRYIQRIILDIKSLKMPQK